MAALHIQSWFGQPLQTALPATDIHAKLAIRQTSNAPLSFRLRDIDCAHAYLKDRGVCLQTARLFGVGLYTGPGTLSGRIVIPIHNEAGSIVAYAGRSIDGSQSRYRFPTGFHKGLELFNLYRYTASGYSGRIVVVEGFFDAMKVFQAGFPAVALMGSTMSQRQADLVAEHFSEIVLLLDGDDAGRSGTRKAISMLGSRVVVKTGCIPDGTQPDELEPDEIKGIIECSC
jgi:5S rRNA maturation endonuclease (ribonuclease M5)